MIADLHSVSLLLTQWFDTAAIVVGVVLAFLKLNCQVSRCWRLAHVPAGPFKVCRRHHPDVPNKPSAADVAASAADDGEIYELEIPLEMEDTPGDIYSGPTDTPVEVSPVWGFDAGDYEYPHQPGDGDEDDKGSDHDAAVERYLQALQQQRRPWTRSMGYRP